MEHFHPEAVLGLVGLWLVRPRGLKVNWRAVIAFLLLVVGWLIFCVRHHPFFQH